MGVWAFSPSPLRLGPSASAPASAPALGPSRIPNRTPTKLETNGESQKKYQLRKKNITKNENIIQRKYQYPYNTNGSRPRLSIR